MSPAEFLTVIPPLPRRDQVILLRMARGTWAIGAATCFLLALGTGPAWSAVIPGAIGGFFLWGVRWYTLVLRDPRLAGRHRRQDAQR